MKKFIFVLLTILPTLVFASSAGLHLDNANNDLADKESLKRGFQSYINYCLACHQLKYQRYNRTFADLGIDEKEGIAKSFLKSTKNQEVYIKSIDKTFHFAKDEKIHLEISRKYNDDILNQIIANTQFCIKNKLKDSNNYFANYILEIV